MKNGKQIIKTFSLDEESLEAYEALKFKINISKLIRETLLEKQKELQK